MNTLSRKHPFYAANTAVLLVRCRSKSDPLQHFQVVRGDQNGYPVPGGMAGPPCPWGVLLMGVRELLPFLPDVLTGVDDNVPCPRQ